MAHYLQSLGVGTETLVGIWMDRSLEMIVGLLGILKAGGAYVPLDPAYPLERLSYMIEDAQLPVLLTQERLAEALPAHWAQLVCIDADQEVICSFSDENLHNSVAPDNPAYVIYTSGSTGKAERRCRHTRRLVQFSRGASSDVQHGFKRAFIAVCFAELRCFHL